MTRPIPVNRAGLHPRTQFGTGTVLPLERVPQPTPAMPAAFAPAATGRFRNVRRFLVSQATGGLLVAAALELGDSVEERHAFLLLVAGIYLLATGLYTAWRTRLLFALDQAPRDAQILGYTHQIVGELVTWTVLTLAAAGALILAGLGLLAWWLVTSSRQSGAP